MQHEVHHGLGIELATRAVRAAWASYEQRFAKYSPRATWTSDTRAAVSFSAAGAKLDGTLEVMAEDVGRHNAVDKVIGRRLLEDALPLDANLMVVSGRTSFELVQKALLAGIPLIAAVSAPSSLAVQLAEQTGITLCGFVRGETFNIYAHPERIV